MGSYSFGSGLRTTPKLRLLSCPKELLGAKRALTFYG